MGRVERSFLLAKQSFAVLRSNPQLMLFPVVSALVTIVIGISFWVPTFFLMGGSAAFRNGTHHLPPLYYVATFVFYLISYFIVIFFNSALVFCAHRNLTGQPATFSDGLQTASSRLPSILGWTLIAATVGWVFRMASERAGLVGRILIGIIGIAWNILTFFVVPILVVERVPATKAIKESGALIKRAWGESLIMSGGLGLFMLLLSLIPIPFLVISFFTGSVLVIVSVVILSVVYWLVLAAIGASMAGIYSTALYLYASQGMQPQAFSAEMFQGAFVHKATLGEKFSRWRN